MKTSENAINLLKQLEGCVKKGAMHIIYDDQNGKPVSGFDHLPHGATIGYGHLIKPGEDFSNGITENMATEILRTDITTAENAVRKNITAPLSQNQFDALVIFVYNIGANNFATSTVVKYINNPNFHSSKYPTLELAWKAWEKSNGHANPGLAIRRAKEFELFSQSV